MNQLLQVRDIAESVRDWAEELDAKVPFTDKGDLCGYCAIASAEISKRLTKAGIKHEIRMQNGDLGSHVFVAVDDHVVDVTATQFSEFANTPVLILHERECDQYWFYKHTEVFDSHVRLRKHQAKHRWPSHQIAYR